MDDIVNLGVVKLLGAGFPAVETAPPIAANAFERKEISMSRQERNKNVESLFV